MTYDVIVIGGSYAGISAALQLARARKDVLVVDAGARRNRSAASSHGFLGFDGADPAEIARLGREQLLAYPTVTWRQGVATHAKKGRDGFEVVLEGDEVVTARRLVLATGVVDELPDIPGVRERWGVSIFACPYCHGYELNRGAIAVLATSPHSAHHAALVADWGTVTYFASGQLAPDDAGRAMLAKRGVTLEEEPVVAVEGEGHEVVLRFASGRRSAFVGLFLASHTRLASPIPAELGCAFEDGPSGAFLKVDMMKETTVPGVFACGDASTPAASLAIAVGEGMRAGASAHQSLVFR